MKTLIDNLKTRRGMYLFDDTYKGMVAYIMGYQFAVMELTGENLSEEIQEWLKNKIGSPFSFHWSDYIYVEMAKKKRRKS